MASLAREATDLDPAYVEAFRRDGFVHVPALIDPGEMARHRSAVDAAVAVRSRKDPRPIAERSLYEQSFSQYQYLWEEFPDVAHLSFHSKVTAAAAALLGAERVRIWLDQALYKEAGGRETEAHQDLPSVPIAEPDALTAWIPLVEVNEVNGCMGYGPGSHLSERRWIDIFGTPGFGKTLEDGLNVPPLFVPASPGDVIFHHGLTVHLAKPNRSNKVRAAHTVFLFRDGCTLASDQPGTTVNRDQIRPGTRIDGPATPIAWPLPNGNIPEPGPWPDFADDHPFARAASLGIVPQNGAA